MVELYRKHRPRLFQQVVGQNSAVELLQNYLENDALPHALLLTGSSGVGKTTIGRIMAEELGCHKEEYREINTADFNGIDMVREIRANINYAPLRGKVKVWLVDECHMLSRSGQEAFLKLLEDPPEFVYFILATTDPVKLLPTVKTRCSLIALETFTKKTMVKFLTKFASENLPDFVLKKNAVELIADNADGSPRKALVALEGLTMQEEGAQTKYLESLAAQETQSIELCRAMVGGAKWKKVAELLKGLDADPESARRHVLGYARSVLLGAGRSAGKAYLVIDCFRNNFYDSKQAGLAAACWEVVYGGDE